MAMEIPITGQVKATVMVNLRQGAPSVKVGVIGKVLPNVSIPVEAIAIGDEVQGNSHWYKTTGNTYAWAGAFVPTNLVGPTAPAGTTTSLISRVATTPAVSVNPPYCIDLYEGDNVIDSPGPLGGFSQVKAQGIAFLDHKATEGTGHEDIRLKTRYPAWMDGKPVSVTDVDGTKLQLTPRFSFYHFNGTGTAADEAAFFISTVKPYFNKGDDLCLDWEDINGFQQPATWADDFCSAVEQWCGFPIKVYGSDAPREQLTKASSAILDNFASRKLWFSDYSDTYRPQLLPLPWQKTGPLQWQDNGTTDNGPAGPKPYTIPGISNYCDNSTVVGTMTVAKLNALWGGGQAMV
jgi:hypothetical protein